MAVPLMFRRHYDREERRRAANVATMIADGIGEMLAALADDARKDGGAAAALIAATYQDASDRARLTGLEIAETIKR